MKKKQITGWAVETKEGTGNMCPTLQEAKLVNTLIHDGKGRVVRMIGWGYSPSK